MSNKLRKRPKERKPQPHKARVPLFQAILVIATLLGGTVAFLALVPRPLVTPSDPVDPNNVFSASFTISNTNFIPLRDVNVLLGMGELFVGPQRPLQPHQEFVPNFESRLALQTWQHHVLNMDDRYTITGDDVFHIQGRGQQWADIAIIVSYKPWILPFRREKIFRFVTRKQTNGQLYWYSLPLGEPIPASYR